MLSTRPNGGSLLWLVGMSRFELKCTQPMSAVRGFEVKLTQPMSGPPPCLRGGGVNFRAQVGSACKHKISLGKHRTSLGQREAGFQVDVDSGNERAAKLVFNLFKKGQMLTGSAVGVNSLKGELGVCRKHSNIFPSCSIDVTT